MPVEHVTQRILIIVQELIFLGMIPGHLPRQMSKSPQKSSLCIFLYQDGRHHVTQFLKKNRGIPITIIPHFCSWKKIFRDMSLIMF